VKNSAQRHHSSLFISAQFALSYFAYPSRKVIRRSHKLQAVIKPPIPQSANLAQARSPTSKKLQNGKPTTPTKNNPPRTLSTQCADIKLNIPNSRRRKLNTSPPQPPTPTPLDLPLDTHNRNTLTILAKQPKPIPHCHTSLRNPPSPSLYPSRRTTVDVRKRNQGG
jgi:hypothetical protein